MKSRRTHNEQEKPNRFRRVKNHVCCILAVGREMDMRHVKLSVKNLIFSDRLNTMAIKVLRTVQMKYSYNKSQREALFLKFIWKSTLHVSDRSTVHHQEYLNTVYTQYVFVMLVMSAHTSVVRIFHPDHASMRQQN
jgi:hypothetical protein